MGLSERVHPFLEREKPTMNRRLVLDEWSWSIDTKDRYRSMALQDNRERSHQFEEYEPYHMIGVGDKCSPY